MSIRISRGALEAIVAQANNAGAEECCGLLLSGTGGATDRIESALPSRNFALNRATHFEIDPATLIAAHKAERDGGPRIIGCYHSHPGGDPAPSCEDAAQAAANGWLWLICGSDTVAAWQAVPAGERHGRFNRTELLVERDHSAP